MKLVILDRDGVITHDSAEYIKSPEEWQPIPGSLAAIARLNRAGYRVVVASNQSGLARGFFDVDTLLRIHDKLLRSLSVLGGAVDAVFFCPHGPDDHCLCRKPKPGLLLDSAARLQTDLTAMPAIGDALRDEQAARAVGARPSLGRTGKVAETEARGEGRAGGASYDDLAAAVDALLGEQHTMPVG